MEGYCMVNELDRVTLARRMETVDDVRAFLRDCLTAFGLGFHEDTPGRDYVNFQDREPTFTPPQAAAFDALMSRAFLVCDGVGVEIYALTSSLPEWLALMGPEHAVSSSEIRPGAWTWSEITVQQSRPAGVDWWPAL